MRAENRVRRMIVLALSACSLIGRMRAQPTDPLISLMMSQPKIEIASNVTATASFDPPVIRPGETSIYRVTFNALEESIQWPDQIAAPAGLEVQPGAHGQMFQMNGGQLEPHTTFNSPVHASASGEFTLPPMVIQVYDQQVRVPGARLTVVDQLPPEAALGWRLRLEVSATNVFAGQSVRARVILPAVGGVFQALGQVQLSGEGFIVEQGPVRQGVERIRVGDSSVQAFVYETMLTPITLGKISLFAQGYTSGLGFAGQIMVTGGPPGTRPQTTLIESPTVELNARPLPREGQLPGFTGAIGSLALGPIELSTNAVRAGDPVQLTVTIMNRGEGSLTRLAPPPPPRERDWQVFAGEANNAAGVAVFRYTLIPLTSNARATPALPFSYYDLRRGGYTDLTIPPMPITVTPGSADADLAALQAGAAPVDAEKEPVLGGLAAAPGMTSRNLLPLQQRPWFALVQLGPIAIFVGLWLWDRRRRYLERHPGILLRRRARRALGREWAALRRAAQVGDAAGFATAAVSALRAACAPHYPAEPKALVGGDVMELLNQGEGTGSANGAAEVVRRFFAVTDASRFGVVPGDAAQLLPLQPELENVLRKLEERLSA